MTQVAVQCPECRRCRVINGRRRCACGVYLVHHAGQSFTVRPRTYFWLGGRWVPFASMPPSWTQPKRGERSRAAVGEDEAS